MAIGAGSANISVGPASLAKFAASTPGGLKIGHTNASGNPASVIQASPIAMTVTTAPLGDVNGDTIRDLADVPIFVNVLLGIDLDDQHIARSDINCDDFADGRDVGPFVRLLVP